MFLFVLSDFAADAHPLGKDVHDGVVYLVNLLTQLADTFGGDGLITDYEQREDVVEHIGSHLLFSITPGPVGITMAFDDKTVGTQVHSLLAEGSDEVAASTDMRGVADDGQFGNTATEFDGNLPHGRVTIDGLVVTGETAVDGSEFLYAGTVQTQEGTDPKFQVGVHGVFHEYRNVHALQGIS